MVGLIGRKRSRQQRERLFISSARAAINIPNKTEAGVGGAAAAGGRGAEKEDKWHEGRSEDVQLSGVSRGS